MYEQLIYKQETIERISKETGLSMTRSLELYFILEDTYEEILKTNGGKYLKNIFEQSRDIVKNNSKSEIMIRAVEYRFSRYSINNRGNIRLISYDEVAELCERTRERVRQILNKYKREMQKCMKSFYQINDPNNMDICALKHHGLDTGITNALMRKGLKRMIDICNFSENELLTFRGIGVGAVEKIKETLSKFNLQLRD